MAAMRFYKEKIKCSRIHKLSGFITMRTSYNYTTKVAFLLINVNPHFAIGNSIFRFIYGQTNHITLYQCQLVSESGLG